jgi:molybdenum cofactor biosynthesis protein A
MPIFDNHGRPINYVRLAVTDRCNLRCFYCMPAEGIKYVPRKDLLTYEEMERLIRLLAEMGVSKVRITGGEPFVRRDLVDFLYRVHEIEGIRDVHLTTNGVLTKRYIPDLVKMGIASVNLSLDTLDRQRFFEITRRDEFPKVLDCLHALIEAGISTKINAVIMAGKNTEDILPLADFTQNHPVGVRYIEEMPFNGNGANYAKLHWNHKRILEKLKEKYPHLQKIDDGPHSTSNNYQVPGHQGTLGIIAAFTRTFCGTCNRIRVTAKGTLKTCLYDDGVLDLREIIRTEKSDESLRQALLQAFGNRARNGFEAEKRRTSQEVSESMSTIGG